MTESERTLEAIHLELGKLRADINDIKANHLKHLADKIRWCDMKTNFILIIVGLTFAGIGLMISMLSLHIGGS